MRLNPTPKHQSNHIHGLPTKLPAQADAPSCTEYNELQSHYPRLDVPGSEYKPLKNKADVDNSGTIDYGEFVAATIHLNKLEREEHLVAAFQYFDKDRSGYITVDELQQACTDHNMTDFLVEDIIKEVDQDNDGRIDYGEFVAMMTKGNARIGRRTMRNSVNISMRDSPRAVYAVL